ncbi:PIG-L deacetylase family protein [Qipengyuania spongiae]|uniref:PIG-L family deacetylase n=1 Tax=Qipengyuania spongiae TaxID=2909673 RepID=A0ABY5SZQ2_9SPHN|nr:PIG-L family deacetylase [Qipengyuania spongiae]UVI39665.1 PIG-L family deacetylase [Qipengyuania spongiae]
MSITQVPEGSLITAAATAPRIDIEAIAPEGTVLILSPHPDDETFGCGLAMAAAAARDRRIAIVMLTDGEGSHPNSRTFAPQQLAHLRSEEFARALETLAPSSRVDVLRLHLPDGKSRYDRMLAMQVLPFTQAHGAKAIWSTWRGDPHCDHQTAAGLGRELARRLTIPHWSFAVWGRFGERAIPTGLKTFHDPGLASRKVKAIAAYRSQIDPQVIDDPKGFTMPPALVAHFAEHPEIFIRD